MTREFGPDLDDVDELTVGPPAAQDAGASPGERRRTEKMVFVSGICLAAALVFALSLQGSQWRAAGAECGSSGGPIPYMQLTSFGPVQLIDPSTGIALPLNVTSVLSAQAPSQTTTVQQVVRARAQGSAKGASSALSPIEP
jgi:hypothetical protein